MDARIGQLGSGKFYAYVNGYSSEPFVGSKDQVETALGLPQHSKPSGNRETKKEMAPYSVLLTFQYPAWNQVDGIQYDGIYAKNKTQANAIARERARAYGHMAGGQGRVTFRATQEDR